MDIAHLMMGSQAQAVPAEKNDIRNTAVPPRVQVAMTYTQLMSNLISVVDIVPDEDEGPCEFPTKAQMATLDACAETIRLYVVGENDYVAKPHDKPDHDDSE